MRSSLTPTRLWLSLGLAMLWPLAAAAQDLAYISVVEDAVTVSRAYTPAPARMGMMLSHGDQVQTQAGRVEISFRDGSVLHVDRNSHVALFDRERLRVIDGRVLFRASSLTAGYEIETDASRFRAMPRGVFGVLVNAANRQTLVTVSSGSAHIENLWGRTLVEAREMAMMSGPTGHPFVTPYVPEQLDVFGAWSAARLAGMQGAATTTRILGDDYYTPAPADGRYADPPQIDATYSGVMTPYYWGGYYYYGSGYWRDNDRDRRDRPRFHDRDGDGGRGDGNRDGNRGGNRGGSDRGNGQRGTNRPAATPAPAPAAPPAPRPASAGAPVRRPK